MSIKKNAAYNIALSASQVLTPLLIFPYVLRVLGPVNMGNIGFVDSCLQFVVLLAALGIPIYGVREIAKAGNDRNKRSRLFSELLFIHLLATVTLSMLYWMLFSYFPQFSVHKPLFMISLGMMYMQVFMVEWLFQGVEAFPFITIRALAIRALSVLLIFTFVKEPDDGVFYYGIILLTGTLNAFVNLAYARKFISLTWHGLNLRQHFKPLLYIFSFGIVVSVYTVLDTTLLGLLRDMEEVGYYSTVVRVVKLVITVLTAIILVVIPQLSVAFKKQDTVRIHGLLDKSFSYIVLIGVPASMGLLVFASELILLFAGDQYGPSVISLQILAPSIIVIGLSNVFGMQILNPSNNERMFFKAALVGMIISLCVNFALIPHFGQYGAAFANLITETVVLSLLIMFSFKVVQFRPNWVRIFQAFAASLLFIPIHQMLHYFELSLPIVFVLGVTLSIVVYFAIQRWVWRNPVVNDLLSFASLKRSLKSEGDTDE